MTKDISDAKLKALLETAKSIKMSPEDREAQRRSFVYGNTYIENEHITRELVDEVAEEMKKGDKKK
jgi:hypothetical protein